VGRPVAAAAEQLRRFVPDAGIAGELNLLVQSAGKHPLRLCEKTGAVDLRRDPPREVRIDLDPHVLGERDIPTARERQQLAGHRIDRPPPVHVSKAKDLPWRDAELTLAMVLGVYILAPRERRLTTPISPAASQ